MFWSFLRVEVRTLVSICKAHDAKAVLAYASHPEPQIQTEASISVWAGADYKNVHPRIFALPSFAMSGAFQYTNSGLMTCQHRHWSWPMSALTSQSYSSHLDW